MSIGIKKFRFRLVDKNRQYLNKLSAVLTGSKIVQTQIGRRYVNLHLIDEQQNEASALLDIDEWLNVKNIELPEIPWESVPLSYLVQWLITSKVEFFWKIMSGLLKEVSFQSRFPMTFCSLLQNPVNCSFLIGLYRRRGNLQGG